MENIGIILIIIFAVASSINKRLARSREAAKKQAPARSKRPEPQGPFQQAMRQFQEAVEKAAGIEPPAKPAPVAAKPPVKDKEESKERDIEPGFRGCIIMEDKPFPERPEAIRPVETKAAAKMTPPEPAPSSSIIPRMSPSSLVQAVVTHEILTRPRTAWHPRREAAKKSVSGG